MELSPDELATTHQFVARNADAIAVIRRALACRQCVFKRDWSEPVIGFPDYANIRAAAEILSLQAAVGLADGKQLDAVRTMSFGYRIADDCASDPDLIAYFVVVSIDATTNKVLTALLYATQGNPAVVNAEQEAIVRGRAREVSLAYALRDELVSLLPVLNEIREEGPEGLEALLGAKAGRTSGVTASASKPSGWSHRVDRYAAYVVWYVCHLVCVLRLPISDQRAALDRLSADLRQRERSGDPSAKVAAFVMPSLLESVRVEFQAEARAACLRAGVTALRWHAAHHAWPQRPAQCMTRVPADPGDGKPPRYRQEGGGFVIYSVGQTWRFDGGKPGARPKPTESLFWWPKPAYWDVRAPATR